MLISDKLVFVELQKTGSTHIKRLLKEIVGGKNDGKHNVPTPELLASGKPFIGSVRDPWGWYLSLWSYGCQQQGELFQRLTNDKKWEKTLERLKSRAAGKDDDAEGDGDGDDEAEAGGKPGKAGKQKKEGKAKKAGLPADLGPERAKSFWYADPESAEAFREWLRVVCSLRLRRVVEAGFAQSPIGKLGGLMTFRYFQLFVRDVDQMPESVQSIEALKSFEAQHLLLSHIIRQDSLSDDLVKALTGCGVELNDAQRKLIYDTKPTNKSTRPRSFEHYYDAASIDLVARRERFIIERFGFSRPRV